MPTPENASAGNTVVLFVAAALLAIGGVLLLVVEPGRPASPVASPSPSASPLDTSVTQTEPLDSNAPSAKSTTAEDDATSPESLPPGAAGAARQFVTAWASHDANPGRDRSFSDAGRRAAAYATADLAALLRDPGDRSTRLWQQWVADKIRVACAIDHVANPEGAPASTSTRVYVRVLYTCTTYSADQQTTRSPGQLALEMHLAHAGVWRVGALVNA